MSHRLPVIDVPRPCPRPWDAMSGTEPARDCAVCGRKVYDLASMTSSEVERLLNRKGERICVRFTKGVDGDIVTADRPPAWQRPRRLRAGLSSAALAAVMTALRPQPASAARPAAAQTLECGPLPAGPSSTVDDKGDVGAIVGTVNNQINEGIEGAIVRAVNESTGDEYWTAAGKNGRYRLHVPNGSYTMGVTCLGFDAHGKPHVRVAPRGETTFDAELRLPVIGETVVIYRLPEEERSTVRSVGGIIAAPFRALARLIFR